MTQPHAAFATPGMIAAYIEETPKRVPGLADLHRMAMLLLAEHAGETAHILVVGAGGGMETLALAEARPGWRFTGVDPAPAMLDLARQTTAPIVNRVELLDGTIDQAPPGPFDGATCILTLHHVARGERLHTLREIRRRLAPGARLVVAEHSAAGPDPARWMARSAAFANRNGVDWARADVSAAVMIEHLPLLTPAEEEELLAEAGYADVALFYAAFSFRGWVATA
jgi:tRNA (cmo5U34)-methyltransferase